MKTRNIIFSTLHRARLTKPVRAPFHNQPRWVAVVCLLCRELDSK